VPALPKAKNGRSMLETKPKGRFCENQYIAKGMVLKNQKQIYLFTNTVIAGIYKEGRYNGGGNMSMAP
jgi:hypothetical protein